jgi:hypothetical protein
MEETTTAAVEQKVEQTQPSSTENQIHIPSETASTLQALGGLVNKDILDQIAKEQASKNPAPAKVETPVAASTEKKEDPASTDGGEKKVEETPAPVKKEKAAEQKEEKAGVFGLKTKKSKDETVVFEKPEDAINYANTEFGMDMKETKDLSKFFGSAKKWREDSQALAKVEAEKQNLAEIFDGLPPEMIQGIKDFYEKGDYSEALSKKPKFDYKQPVEKVDTKKLVEAYFPGKFAEDDFKEGETPSPALEIAIQASKDKYVFEKSTREERLAKVNQEASQKVNARKESIKSSVENLSKEFPHMDKAAIKQVEKVLESGDLTSLFFSKDGTYDKSAATRIAVAIFKDDILKEAMGAAANDAETKVLEDVITRGADGKNPVKSTGGAENLPENVKKQISDIQKMGTKKNVF